MSLKSQLQIGSQETLVGLKDLRVDFYKELRGEKPMPEDTEGLVEQHRQEAGRKHKESGLEQENRAQTKYVHTLLSSSTKKISS